MESKKGTAAATQAAKATKSQGNAADKDAIRKAVEAASTAQDELVQYPRFQPRYIGESLASQLRLLPQDPIRAYYLDYVTNTIDVVPFVRLLIEIYDRVTGIDPSSNLPFRKEMEILRVDLREYCGATMSKDALHARMEHDLPPNSAPVLKSVIMEYVLLVLNKAQDAQKVQDLTDTLKRVQADFENHIKQSEKRSAQQCEHASARVLIKVLSIVDDFERALKTLEDAKIDAKLLEGMRMVNKNIHGVLEAEGVHHIDCVGKLLDPFKHEVLRRVKKDGVKEDTIIEEHVRGYMLKDKVLRFAKVTVAHNGE